MKKEIILLIISIFMISFVSATNGCNLGDSECSSIPTDNCDVTQNTTFITETYNLPNGIDICSDNIVLDCNMAVLNGSAFFPFGDVGGVAINVNFDRATIMNCNIRNYNYGFVIINVDNNTIINNDLNSINFFGINMQKANNNTINNNKFIMNHAGGIYISGSSNLIENNLLMDNRGIVFGGNIHINKANNNIIKNNTLKSSFNGIILKDSNNNFVIENVAVFNDNPGIALFGSNRNIIENNNVSSNLLYGIGGFFNSNLNTFSGNFAYSNSVSGLALAELSNNNTIINNYFLNSPRGISLFQNVSYNLIFNNFINNTNNAQDNGQNLWNTTLDCTQTNIIGGPCIGGNFWSDYTGEDIDSNGIGDTIIPFGPGDYLPLILIKDADSDGIPDSTDNCPETPNPNQEDSNNNGIGNACEKNQIAADCNQDGILNVFDIVCYIKALYPGFNLLDRTQLNFPCNTEEANKIILDINGDNEINNKDIAYLGEYLFKNGPAPVQGLMCINAIDCPNNFACEIGEGASTSKTTIKEAIEQIEKNQEIEPYVKEQTLSLLNQYQQCALNGDVDQNKKVNLNDYYALKYYLSGSYKINSCLCNTDVNEDKKIDYSDASALYYASYYNNLPKEGECETIQSPSPNPSISPTPYY